MTTNIIITPTFNDWQSLSRLINKINTISKKVKGTFKIIIINDCSTSKKIFKKKKYKNIKSIKIINLKKNLGSQKAILIGLKYIKKKKIKSIITVMDSDGEDDPNKIPKLIKLANQNQKSIITANRLKRTEPIFYKLLNSLRLILTFLITGKYLNFGNYSSFHSSNLKKILYNSNLALAYSAGISKNCKKIVSFPTKKRKRYCGVSKVSFGFLFKHSLNIITVFRNQVILRSLLISLFSFYFFNFFLFLVTIVCLIILNLFIFFNKIDHKHEKYKINLIKSVKKI
jgi:hypothetical protein